MTREFGPVFGLQNLERNVLPRSSKAWRKLELRYCRHMKSWFASHLFDEAAKAFTPADFAQPIGEGCPIWVFWFQGEDAMPPLMKQCWRSVQKNAAGHPIVMLTKDNFQQYAQFPPEILQKFESGCIDITKLSDILRFKLLADRGGLYLDATLMLIRPFPEEIFRKPYYTLRHEQGADWLIGGGRWTCGVQAAAKGNPMMKYLYEMHRLYWSGHRACIGYAMLDSMITLGCERIPEMNAMMEQVAPNNRGTFDLMEHIAEPFDEELYTKIVAENYLLRFTYKMPPIAPEGTLYGHLLDLTF